MTRDRPGTDHVVFTKPRTPSRPALASLFARSWSPPFTLTAVAARRSPTDNPPVGLRPIPRNARWPDPYCSLGFRLAQQSGAWSAAAPSISRGAAVFSVAMHRLFTGRPQAFPLAIHRTAISRASLGTDEPRADCSIGSYSFPESERGLDAASFMPPNPARPRFATRTTLVPAIAHLGTLPAPARYLGWAMLSGGSKTK
jgi:hypothetical protein